jgi:hypothetical protein
VKINQLLHTFTIEWNLQTLHSGQDIWFPVAASIILIYSVQTRLQGMTQIKDFRNHITQIQGHNPNVTWLFLLRKWTWK